MTTIRRFPFVSHATSDATRFLVHGTGGSIHPRGTGASFWFRPLGSTLSEVPVEDLELGSIVRVTTSDRQEVSVQLALTVRIVEPELAARRLDFAIDLATGEWTGRPLQTLQNRVAEAAGQFTARTVARTSLAAVLGDGLELVRDAVRAGFAAEAHLADSGIEMVSVRVVAVRPEEDVERALQTTVREAIQAEADRATYDRRAQAVDRERAIKENELHTRTELARREAELVELVGSNDLRRTEQELDRADLRARADLAGKRLEVDARVDEIARVAAAENEALGTRLAAYDAAGTTALLASIAPDVLAALPRIDSLTITPDMLADALGRVLAEVRS
ncbi:MAG: hypothetical protein BGO96_12275 [Micrococcales bacterium 73-15]|uniref:SPFH domain-containing protein n=1 Tax=Salana multivorans TaxID=120377 RepID=UPI000960DCE1|nr:SPFH domain-containing protein [Salana multivorans]OJX97713.1 MAG: hypothetical protein BGO96_12275 [Micrococcales bacterium 73-15]